ncbi:MAG: membrane protein insertase YidC [Chloroflexi bacterium]|nr:membrane protein insertase YidC [Chloroflexota bacterium]
MGEFLGIIIDVMMNSLIFLYGLLGDNFGISIIAFTIIVRIAMYPLTRKQLRASKAMSTLQPRIREIQQKYSKDKAKISQETMRLYKEEGVNPIGCLGPMMIQMPIWIGLYQSIIKALPSNPEGLVSLSQRLWSWVPGVHEAIPLNEGFLWLDLSEPDPSRVLLPILVGGSMWVQQKMMTSGSTDPKQASMNKMMLWMMPVMFGMFTLGFPSGLALYWVVSNMIGIALQYRASGWGNLLPASVPGTEAAKQAATDTSKEMVVHGELGSDGQDGGGGDRAGAEGARRRPRRGRRRRRHRR